MTKNQKNRVYLTALFIEYQLIGPSVHHVRPICAQQEAVAERLQLFLL